MCVFFFVCVFCFSFLLFLASRAIWKPFYRRLRFWVVPKIRILINFSSLFSGLLIHVIELFLFSDDFSFFAVFHFVPRAYSVLKPEAILRELTSAITDKLKFVVCPSSPSSNVLLGPETLLAVYSCLLWGPNFLKMLQEILNKRWQTLDLKSMMSELRRSSSEIMATKDSLSSVHRFKRKVEASLS